MASRMSEHHQEELSRFLKFFRSRMKTHIENIEADFEDTCSDRLSGDDMYSQKDVKDAINSLCFAVKANVRSELQDTINMMALLLRQIFTEAEDSKLSLELDIGMVEDRSLLERVERLSVAEWVSDSRASISVLPPSGSDKDKEKVAAAAAAAAKAKAKEEEIARQLEREKKQHEEEIRAAAVASKQQQDAQEAAHAKELKRLQRKLDAASDRAEELAGQLEEAQQHVAATKQFLALKKMVSTKNDQLQELRRRLRRYEPDAGDDDDAKNADDDE